LRPALSEVLVGFHGTSTAHRRGVDVCTPRVVR
jgi:hypothetical protein